MLEGHFFVHALHPLMQFSRSLRSAKNGRTGSRENTAPIGQKFLQHICRSFCFFQYFLASFQDCIGRAGCTGNSINILRHSFIYDLGYHTLYTEVPFAAFVIYLSLPLSPSPMISVIAIILSSRIVTVIVRLYSSKSSSSSGLQGTVTS